MTYQKNTGCLSPGAHAGSYNGQDAYNDMLVIDEENEQMELLDRRRDSGDTYRSKCGGDQRMPDKENFNAVTDSYAVRRLTPLECERLQGFPDGWTDIGEWEDSKGKKHKPADAPRYKALGNSIAIPYWFVLLRRISAQYDRPATLGSLFDGIGGFPLCWEQCNGRGTALWASEIEEFPIAVTKLRFPEEDSEKIERGGSQKIVFENHSQDSRYRYMGNTCFSLTARLGTGGNNQPLVVNEEDS